MKDYATVLGDQRALKQYGKGRTPAPAALQKLFDGLNVHLASNKELFASMVSIYKIYGSQIVMPENFIIECRDGSLATNRFLFMMKAYAFESLCVNTTSFRCNLSTEAMRTFLRYNPDSPEEFICTRLASAASNSYQYELLRFALEYNIVPLAKKFTAHFAREEGELPDDLLWIRDTEEEKRKKLEQSLQVPVESNMLQRYRFFNPLPEFMITVTEGTRFLEQTKPIKLNCVTANPHIPLITALRFNNEKDLLAHLHYFQYCKCSPPPCGAR